MGNRLFVGGLAWAAGERELREAFEPFGTVTEATVIIDRETGKSRGFGFVTFENDQHAQAAVQAMDGASLGGRRVNVRAAEERAPRGPGGPGGPGGPPRERRGPPGEGRGGYGGGGGGYGGGGGGYSGGGGGGYGGGGGGGYRGGD
ncbi:RNA-binding protein, partial [Myxococcota bacterium]|nr:RNA-binding protein [Myxococcota bacterium]